MSASADTSAAFAGIGRAVAAVPGVRLALLFGSVARGTSSADSDVDIAFDVHPGTDLAELTMNLVRAIGRDAQLVLLSDATIPLLDEIVHDGIVVHEGQPHAAAHWRTHALASLELDRPWYARMRDAWLRRVAEDGLEHGCRTDLAAKLADLVLRVSRVRKHAKASAEDLVADLDALDLVAFNLMVAVQICVDIASHAISDAGWPAARTLAESFSRLHEHGVLSQDTATALSRAAGLRNVVAHGYAAVDVGLVHMAATEGVRNLDSFAREIAAWLLRQPRVGHRG